MATTADDWSIYWTVAELVQLMKNYLAGIEALTEEIAAVTNLTVTTWLAVTLTGDAYEPTRLNDGNTANYTSFGALDYYVEADFTDPVYITQYRHYGQWEHTPGAGLYKIQHWDGSNWIDNTVDIPTRSNSWSDWIGLTTPILTSKIRLVVTQLDNGGACRVGEMEMKA